MPWDKIADLGSGAIIAAVTLYLGYKLIRWMIPYLIDEALEPLRELVNSFEVTVTNHLSHQAEEHKVILRALKKILKNQGED